MPNTINKVLNFLLEKKVGLIFILIILAVIILLLVVSMIYKKTASNHRENVIKVLSPGVFVWLTLLLVHMVTITYFPNIIDNTYIEKALSTLIVLGVGFSFYKMTILITYFLEKVDKTKVLFSFDETLRQWVVGGAKIVVLIIIILNLLSLYNVNITALVAGLGVGGIAIALAAQDTLANILGYIVIILDKPFVIGSRIKILGYDGNIEKVGLRSTHLRTFDGGLVMLPNKTVSNTDLENVTERDSIRQVEMIILDPQLSTERLRFAIDNIKDILYKMNGIKEDYKVFFEERNATSVLIKIWYWVNSTDYWVFMDVKEKVNYAIYSFLEENDIKYSISNNGMYIKSV